MSSKIIRFEDKRLFLNELPIFLKDWKAPVIDFNDYKIAKQKELEDRIDFVVNGHRKSEILSVLREESRVLAEQYESLGDKYKVDMSIISETINEILDSMDVILVENKEYFIDRLGVCKKFLEVLYGALFDISKSVKDGLEHDEIKGDLEHLSAIVKKITVLS